MPLGTVKLSSVESTNTFSAASLFYREVLSVI